MSKNSLTKITEILKGSLGKVDGLSDDFEWKKVGNFSVITGKNGSGKTNLLKVIHKKWKDLPARYIKDDYKFYVKDGRIPGRSQLDNGKNFSSLKEKMDGHSISPDDVDQFDRLVFNYILKQRKSFLDRYDQQIEELTRMQKFQDTDCLLDLLPDKEENYEPWDFIDKILSSPISDGDGFDLKITLDRVSLNRYELSFKKNKKNVEIENLSSGERVALAISFWMWASEQGAKTKILLIDEFDAHLNPCLMKSFVNAIKKYFVDQDVQVIMTTHSPVTVAYARDCGAKIIWMEDGLIQEKNEQKIIEDLSSGLISVMDLMSDVRILVNDVGNNKDILYTEGKTDPIYLDGAKNIFGYAEKLKDIHFMGCTSDSAILDFVNLRTGRVKVALFDNPVLDPERLAARKYLEKQIKQKNCRILNIPEGFNEIECLFDKEFLQNPHSYLATHLSAFSKKFQKYEPHWDCKNKKFNGDKNPFANKIKSIVDEVIAENDQVKIEAVKKIFKNFEPLLDNIENAFKKSVN